MVTRVYGYSDDNIEFEGGLKDEVGCYGVDLDITFSDGTKIRTHYGKVINGETEGVWSITVLNKGLLFDRLELCFDADADIYSDILYLKDGITSAFQESAKGELTNAEHSVILRQRYTQDELKFYELNGLPVSWDERLPIFGKCDQLDDKYILARKVVHQAVVRDAEGNPGIIYYCPECKAQIEGQEGIFTFEDALTVSADRFIQKQQIIHEAKR